jgi:photoactive yellow protein
MRDIFDFDDPSLGSKLDTLPEKDLNSLSYGTVRVKTSGEVVFFSSRERHLSGYKREALGLNWLEHIAPCMQTSLFKDHLQEAIQRTALDVLVETTGDFNNPDQTIELRMISSSTPNFIWFALKRV